MVLCQSSKSNSIELCMLTDTVAISKTNEIELEYSIKNLSDTNIILYRTTDKIFHFPSRRVEALCDREKTGAGLVFILFDKNLKWQSARHRVISDYSNSMTKERADSAIFVAKAESLKATLILKKNEIRVFKERINISSFELLKGHYLIELIYYAGRKIDHFADESQQKIDMNVHKASVYQGCVSSEKALILVN